MLNSHAHGDGRMQSEVVRQVAHQRSPRSWLAPGIDFTKDDATATSGLLRREDPEQRGLPRTGATEYAAQTAWHDKRHVIECLLALRK